jgi:hypothetical protein
MLTKKYLKSRDKVRVTFEVPFSQLPDGLDVDSIAVAGDFNGWDPDLAPMKAVKSAKAYKTNLDLDPGSSFQFRYFVNGESWVNDWDADGYVPNDQGTENCLVKT